ncbi:MAG: hypothetical protein KA732_00675 [Providencia sp.]|uniref:hypothetical protein n=1 Tax=Providencia sp. TaxID=589 RepID=UPI001B7AE123|nr:hypothetical protein [Providencia sp.]
MAKSRTVTLTFKNGAGTNLPPVSFIVNDGENGDNANIQVSSIIPTIKGGETSFSLGNVVVLSVQINGISQPQGYAYTVEGTTLYLAEALKNGDFISIEVTK